MRNVLVAICILTLTGGALMASEGPSVDPAAALKTLKEGNARSAAGKLVVRNHNVARRTELARSQHPIAVVVACSDSRVPPEIVFDQGLGDLFVIRVAGEVLDAPSLGSIEYAIDHLGARLIVVLGHERCGAVQAAIDGGVAHPHIDSLVNAIKPAVADAASATGNKSDAVSKANVKRVVAKIEKESVHQKDIKVVGMFYDLDTGLVEAVQ